MSAPPGPAPARQNTPLKGGASALARLIGSEKMVADAQTESGAFRLSFNDQFFIEVEDLRDNLFRVSARVVRLSQGLTVRENQVFDALKLFATLRNSMPAGLSLAVSKHDRCLRLMMEFESAAGGHDHQPDLAPFIHTAHAFKQLFIRQATPK